MIKLSGMEFLKKAVSKDMAVLAIESLHASVILNKKTNKIKAVVVKNRKVKEALEHLHCIKKSIVKHGASESLFAYVNVENTLSNVLGISIPTVNSINAQAVGHACVEGIDEKTEESMSTVQQFFADLINAIEDQYKKMQETHAAQKEALEVIKNDILTDITHIDAVAFSKEEADVYAQCVAMDRVGAINAFLDKLGNEAINDSNAEEYRSILEVLGKKVETDLEIRDETTDEAEQTAPAPEEVFHEETVVIISEQTPEEMAGINTVDEDEVVADAPTSEEAAPEATDAPEAEVPVEELPAKEELEVVPADYAQEKTLVAHGWTPDTIDAFISSVIGILSSTSKLNLIGNRVKELQEKTLAALAKPAEASTSNEDEGTPAPVADAAPETSTEPAVEEPAAPTEEPAAPVEGVTTVDEDAVAEVSEADQCIDKCRAEASFYADALCVVDCAISELVSQSIVLAGKLKKQEVEETAPEAVNVDDVVQSDYVDGTPAEDVTEEDLAAPAEEPTAPVEGDATVDEDGADAPAAPEGSVEEPAEEPAPAEEEKPAESEETTNDDEVVENPEGEAPAETESNPESEEDEEDEEEEGEQTTANKGKVKKKIKKFARK